MSNTTEKKLPACMEGMQRNPNGTMKRKKIGVQVRNASALLKQRFGKMYYKVLKEQLTEDVLSKFVKTIIKIGTEYPEHKDYGRISEMLWELGIKDPRNDRDSPQINIQMILQQQQEGADSARLRLGLKPINVEVIESKSTENAGNGMLGVVRQLPAPVPVEDHQ